MEFVWLCVSGLRVRIFMVLFCGVCVCVFDLYCGPLALRFYAAFAAQVVAPQPSQLVVAIAASRRLRT